MSLMENSPLRVFSEIVQQREDRIDLGYAALVMAQPEYPGLDIEAYVRRIDWLAEQVHKKVRTVMDPYRLIAGINDVLFAEEGIRGNRDNYYDPRNSFLNEVLERKLGIPITISVLYIEVARRLGLTLHGVGLPGHFLVKYVGEEEETVIDPFHSGQVRSIEELQALLNEIYGGKVAFRSEFLSPVTKRQVLQRMLHNLKAIYLRQGDLLKSLSAVERLAILDPSSAQEIRDRGLLYLRLECVPQAVEDLEAYLRLAPEAEDADAIREQVVTLRSRVPQIH